MNNDPLYGALLKNQPSLVSFRAKNYLTKRIANLVLVPDVILPGKPYVFCVYDVITLEIALAITLEDPWKILDLCAKMANKDFLIDLMNEMENANVWELHESNM